MKKAIRIFFIGVWLLLGTFFLGRWWYAHPNTFPRLPDAVWSWLDKLYGANNIDGASDVELLVVLFFAFTTVSVVTWTSWIIWCRIHKQHD